MLVPKQLPVLVFLVTAAIGLVLPVAAYRSGAQANYLRFERLADEAVDRVSTRITQHISLLIATRSLFEAQSGNVSYRQFASFVEHLNINGTFNGIQGIGYAAVVPPGGDDWVRERLRANYGIARDPFPRSSEDLRTAIIMLEPDNERNRAALGYDMYSDKTRRVAMQAAMLSGEARASDKVELLQEIDGEKQAGFLVFLPLQANQRSPAQADPGETVAPLGFVYAPFRAGDLIDAALNTSSWLPVHLEVHDGEPDKGDLLFRSTTKKGGQGKSYTVRRDLDIAGRQWSVMVSPSTGFREGTETGIALLLGAISLLMAAALAVSMRAQIKALDASREVIKVSEAAAAQKDFLLQEMKHRIKNSIARVLAIARQTANHSDSLQEFTESFTNRLQAMSASQDILTHSHQQKADLNDLLQAELQQVFGDDFDGKSCSGPKQQLGIRTTQALALVFHELATNALKYARMDENGSRLDIDWRSGANGKSLAIDWRENSAAFADAQEADAQDTNGGGFGTKLMRSLVEGELSGRISREMTPDGLHVRIEVPNPLA